MERYDEIFIPIHDLDDDWTVYVNTDPEHRQLHHFVQFKMFEKEKPELLQKLMFPKKDESELSALLVFLKRSNPLAKLLLLELRVLDSGFLT